MLETCTTIEAGAPEILPNRGLYGFSKLPFHLGS